MKRHYIIPIFVPHFGCPHNCVFCNQKKITGLSTTVTSKDVDRIISEHLATFKDGATIEVAFFGGSFTAIDIDIQRELLDVPVKYKKEKKIDAIRLSTRPDAIDVEVLDMLKENLVDTIELGVQSLDDEVLYKSGRGHSVEDVYDACELIKKYNINLGLQMMLGLPGDTREKSIYTCKEFIKLNPFCVRIYPTLVIKDTFLESEYENGNYQALDIDEAVDLSSILLMMFTVNNINVIRIGLQPTENIQMGKDVVAGPFHPAFRQLVESDIYIKLLESYFFKEDIQTKSKDLLIEANNKLISSISGQKSCNRKFLMQTYKFNKIKIIGRDMDLNKINIKIEDHTDSLDIRNMIYLYLNNNLEQ